MLETQAAAEPDRSQAVLEASRSRWFQPTVGLAAAVVAVAVVAWAIAPFGPILSADSVGYVSTAQSLRSGSGLGYWLEPQLTTWPPLYPLLLALLPWPVSTTQLVGPLGLQLSLLAICAVLVSVLASRLIRSKAIMTVVTVAVICSPWILDLGAHIWSELLMIDLVLGAVVIVPRAAELGRRGAWWAVVCGGLAALAFLARYVGAVAMPTLAFAVVVAGPGTRRHRVGRAAGLAAIPLAVIVAQAVANVARGSGPFGPRHPSVDGLAANTADALTTLGRMVTGTPSMVLGSILVAVFVAAAAVVLHAKPTITAVALISFAVGYAVAIVALRTISGFDPLTYRLMAPAFIPVVLILASGVDEALRRVHGVRAAAVIVISLLPLILIGQETAAWATSVRDAGRDLTSRSATEGRAAFAMPSLPAGCAVSTNDPFTMSLAGWDLAEAPRRVQLASEEPVDDVTSFGASLDERPACVVWVADTQRTGAWTPDELAQRFDVTQVAHSPFADVYVIRRPR